MMLARWGWIAMILILMGIVFEVKHAVRKDRHHLARLETEITQQQNTLRILQAEWSHLNHPNRLARLADQYLDLQPLEPHQILSSHRFEEFLESPLTLSDQTAVSPSALPPPQRPES